MLPLIGGRLSRNAGWSLLGTALLTLGVYLIGRHLALGSALPQAISPALGNRTLLERLPVGGAIWLESLRLAVLPTDFPPQYREWFLFERVSWWRSPLMGWLLFFAPLAVVLAKRRLSVASSAVLLAVFALLPVTQLVPLGEIFAPRFLYLPLLFLSVPVGLGLASWLPSGQTNKALLGLALVLSCALHWRAEVYSGKQAWLDAMLQQQPADVPALNSLGLHLEEQGQAQDAIQLWLQATRLDPKYSRPWSNLGRVQMAQGDLDGAEESLRMALRAGPKNPVPRVNLATLLTRQGEHAQAVELYREATRLSPGLGAAWRGLGLALVKLGQLDAARSSLEKALQLDPGDALAKEQWRRISPPQQTHD
jgi:Tfp pilus assembly protein PilF